MSFAEGAAGVLAGLSYHFYGTAHLLRADDLVVRGKVSELLNAARRSVQAAERDFRHEFLPAPSREKPRPDARAVADAQRLERLGAAIGALEGHVRALPVPENDRLGQRFRAEAAVLQRLLEADRELIGHAEFLRSVLQSAGAAWMLENGESLAEQIGAIEAAIQARRDVLVF
jgi:hypothetical protein